MPKKKKLNEIRPMKKPAPPEPKPDESEDMPLATGALADELMREAGESDDGPVVRVEDADDDFESGSGDPSGPSGDDGSETDMLGPVVPPGDDSSCPPTDERGDKTPAFFAWQCRNAPLHDVKKRYIGRIVAGALMTEETILRIRG